VFDLTVEGLWYVNLVHSFTLEALPAILARETDLLGVVNDNDEDVPVRGVILEILLLLGSGVIRGVVVIVVVVVARLTLDLDVAMGSRDGVRSGVPSDTTLLSDD
jgi:hypothetical protein